jgi:protein-L-isoaspartate O-methyltransferase
MAFPSNTTFSYPIILNIINRMIKRYINTYWAIIDLFARNNKKISDLFYQHTIQDEYQKEHQAIQLKKTDVILHIGCGVYPYSAIQLSTKPHKKIVAIDNNKHIIHYAQSSIQEKQFDKTIDIKLGEGASYNLHPFSVIVISSCVNLSRKVLQHIITTANPGTRIIIRELRPMSKYLHSFLKQQKSITLEQKYRTFSFPFYIMGWDSFIIKKKVES